MNKKENILVAGANGTTGKIIIDLLKESSLYPPIAMVRKEEQKEHFEEQGVTPILADLEEDVNHAFKDVDKVIFAAGSKGKKLVEVDQEGAKRLADAAKRAEARKFVMLSSISADEPSASDDLKDYLKAKQNADNHLRDSGLSYSIVRPGRLTNESSTGKIKVQKKLEKAGKITRADVAKVLVGVLDQEIMLNETFELINGDTPIENALN